MTNTSALTRCDGVAWLTASGEKCPADNSYTKHVDGRWGGLSWFVYSVNTISDFMYIYKVFFIVVVVVAVET